MALDPLASTADLDARDIDGGSPDVALAVASSLVRDAAGCTISQETSTVVVTGTRANLLGLPGPVTAVSSVAFGSPTEVLSTCDYEILPNGLWRHCGWGWRDRPRRVTVTYTHGLAVVPDDIVDLTCQLAKAWLDHAAAGGGSTAGLQSVGIDDAREAYTAEASGQISPVYIPDATRQWLARRFGSGVGVVEAL